MLAEVISNDLLQSIDIGPEPAYQLERALIRNFDQPQSKASLAEWLIGDHHIDSKITALDDPVALERAMTNLTHSPEDGAFRAESRTMHAEVQSQQLNQQETQAQTQAHQAPLRGRQGKLKMRQITRLCVLAVMLTVVATGCAVAQRKGAKHMLIDRFSTNIWNDQVLLTADQRAKFQAEFVGKLEKLLPGKYVIRAQHIYLLPPDHRAVPNPVISRMDFNNMMMDVDPGGPELVFANETIDWPYVNVWKTSGSHPEFVAFSLYRNSGSNTLLGYFELQPTK